MAQNISDKSKQALRAAVSRYNSMLTKYQNKYDPTYLPPRASIEDIMTDAMTDKDIRNEISRLQQFRTLEDFQQASEYDFPVSVGEVRDLRRVTNLSNAKARRRAAKIRASLGELNPNEIQEATRELVKLETPTEPIRNIKSRKQFDFAHTTRSSELRNTRTKLILKNKYRFINTVKNVASAMNIDLSAMTDALEAMNIDEVEAFLEAHGSIDVYEIPEFASLMRANAGRVIMQKTEPGSTRRDLLAINNALGEPVTDMEEQLGLK